MEINSEGTLRLKLGETQVRLMYRRPEPGEVIEALVKKMPRGDEASDAQRILMTNLELGRACITGIGPGDLEVEGRVLDTDPESPGFTRDWRELVAERAPLLLIALGQYLSAAPAFMEEPALKKACGMPGQS